MIDPELSIRPLQAIAFSVYTGAQTSVAIDRKSFRFYFWFSSISPGFPG